MVVRDHDAAHARLLAQRRLLRVQHAFDKERQAGGRAVPRNVVPVLGAHRLAEHDVVLAVAVKNMVDVHADRHCAQLFGLAQLGHHLVLVRKRFDDAHERRARGGNGRVLLRLRHADQRQRARRGRAAGHLHQAVLLQAGQVGQRRRHDRRLKTAAKQLQRDIRPHRADRARLDQKFAEIILGDRIGIKRADVRFVCHGKTSCFSAGRRARLRRAGGVSALHLTTSIRAAGGGRNAKITFRRCCFCAPAAAGLPGRTMCAPTWGARRG